MMMLVHVEVGDISAVTSDGVFMSVYTLPSSPPAQPSPGHAPFSTSPTEAQAFGTMLVAYGYVYPLQNHRKLVLCPDATLYRFQVNLSDTHSP